MASEQPTADIFDEMLHEAKVLLDEKQAFETFEYSCYNAITEKELGPKCTFQTYDDSNRSKLVLEHIRPFLVVDNADVRRGRETVVGRNVESGYAMIHSDACTEAPSEEVEFFIWKTHKDGMCKYHIRLRVIEFSGSEREPYMYHFVDAKAEAPGEIRFPDRTDDKKRIKNEGE